jgi:hypothetical protein
VRHAERFRDAPLIQAHPALILDEPDVPVRPALACGASRGRAAEHQIEQRGRAIGRQPKADVRPAFGIEAATARLFIRCSRNQVAAAAPDDLGADLIAAAVAG